MDARYTNFLRFIRNAPRFTIPIYQRKYSWKKIHREQLWSDIIRAGEAENAEGHFIGSIVYVADADDHEAPLLVIDGQQRLTTLTLFLVALRNVLGDREIIDGFSREKIEHYYLIKPLERGENRRRLSLSETDSDTLFAIVDGNDLPENHSLRIEENYNFFKEKLEKKAEDPEFLKVVCRGIQSLGVVYIALTRNKDNPQLIFESMNSTGLELSQADLIRNYVLMGLETDLQSRLYTQYWRHMEIAFGQAEDNQFDNFMRHYLTIKDGNIPKIKEVYIEFKHYAHKILARDNASIEDIVKDVYKFSKHYCAMALGKEENAELKLAFRDLRELNASVAYPFLLDLYADYDDGRLSQEEFLEAVRLIESYVFRRAVCSIPTNSLNKTFANFNKSLKKDRYLESIKAQFRLLPSYRRFPSDDEFGEEMKRRDLYNFQRASYWLRRMENFERQEMVEVHEYTIEHIMPQNPNLSDAWKKSLGENWENIHEKYLHTLGNLTLTGYNSEYSDKPFKDKKDIKGGFNESPLRLNAGLSELDDWNEDAIIARAEKLCGKSINVWKSPDISPDILEAYRPEQAPHSTYSIEDHPHLLTSPIRELFESFRKEVLNLDPCVSEEILKIYIAYKAETNFVDIIPQAKALQLSINIEFSNLNDPKGICRDVTHTGRWGNGNAEVKLSTPEEIPYIIGLVRQALESQLGSASDNTN